MEGIFPRKAIGPEAGAVLHGVRGGGDQDQRPHQQSVHQLIFIHVFEHEHRQVIFLLRCTIYVYRHDKSYFPSTTLFLRSENFHKSV